MTGSNRPPRWQSSDQAIRAVQMAFDVELEVLNAVRTAAFNNDLSTSDQIRLLLGLPVTRKPKRPRLTVSLSPDDYAVLGARYGVPPENHLAIKEKVLADLISFAQNSTMARRR
jgi:hypothetical protein